MRRSTPNCSPVAVEQRRLLASLAKLDVVRVGQTLEPFVTPERRERLHAVIDARLDSITLLMDAPHDPHNGAAVLRSCDVFGVQRLHVVERVEPFISSNAVSRGSERWVDVHTYANASDAIEALSASGHDLVAAHPNGTLLPRDLTEIRRMALVVGNERQGIDAELAKACKWTVRVPMRGFATSLNVSVTAAILLEHATVERGGDLSEAERAFLYARALVLTVPHASEILAACGVATHHSENRRLVGASGFEPPTP